MLAQYHVKLKPEAYYVNWRFFTKASISIEKNMVKLEQEGKIFYLKILSQEDVKIQKNKNVEPYTSRVRPISGVRMVGATVSPRKDN